MNGPHTYAELSPLARKLMDSASTIKRKAVKTYEYIGDGTNLPKMVEKESVLHKYLSPCAISDEVSQEFGEVVDYFV